MATRLDSRTSPPRCRLGCGSRCCPQNWLSPPTSTDCPEQMHGAYLEGRPELRPESLQEALQWAATTPTFPNGANSLLIGSAEQGYLAFDYLIDLPISGSIPDPAWSALVESVPIPDAYMIAERALQSGYIVTYAIFAYRRAAEAGNMPSEASLADLGMPIRSAEESLNRAKEYLRTIRQEFGLDHEKSLAAEQSVIAMTIHSGCYDRALMLLQEMLPRSDGFSARHTEGSLQPNTRQAYAPITWEMRKKGSRKLMQLYEKPKTCWGSMTAQSALER